MSTDEVVARGRAPGPDEVVAVRRTVEELRARLAEGDEVIGLLRDEVAQCRALTGEVTAVLAATVRHARQALAVVDADLRVLFASPAAAARLGDGDTLHPVLGEGGAFAVRRFLGPAADAESEPDPEPSRHGAGRRRARGRMTVAGDGVEVSVRRVEPVRGSLGGLWGTPGRAHGVVLLTAPDDPAPA